MIRVNNIHLSLDYDDKSVRKAVAPVSYTHLTLPTKA